MKIHLETKPLNIDQRETITIPTKDLKLFTTNTKNISISADQITSMNKTETKEIIIMILTFKTNTTDKIIKTRIISILNAIIINIMTITENLTQIKTPQVFKTKEEISTQSLIMVNTIMIIQAEEIKVMRPMKERKVMITLMVKGEAIMMDIPIILEEIEITTETFHKKVVNSTQEATTT